MTPWEHHPDLQRGRLIEIARLIHQARNDALDRQDPSVGSNPWTVGCEAYAFGIHQIIQAEPEHEWLTVLQPGMQFVFAIGDVRVRFYKGAPDEPTKRTLRQTFSELHQPSLFGLDEMSPTELLYRIAVETDFDGQVAAISFVILDGESPILTWSIPMDEPVTRIAAVDIPDAEGVELSKPRVIVPGVDQDKKDGTEDD